MCSLNTSIILSIKLLLRAIKVETNLIIQPTEIKRFPHKLKTKLRHPKQTDVSERVIYSNLADRSVSCNARLQKLEIDNNNADKNQQI